MAYAAARSLLQILEQLKGDDPKWVLHSELLIDSLQEKVSFLSDFLEEFSMSTTEAVKDLEKKVRDAAYEAEDIIESYVWNQLSEISCANELLNFRVDMEMVTQKISSLKEEAMEIKRCVSDLESVQQGNSLYVDRSRLTFSGNNTMVGFDEELLQIKDWLTSSSHKLEAMSIVGMGGLGKTTLARNIFTDSLTVDNFDVRAWVTVSQEYQMHEILAGLLDSMGKLRPEMRGLSSEDLAECLYKSLKGRRYLIVMDDLWETKLWDDVRRFFPDDNNGSRIVFTTRLNRVGVHAASGNHILELRFLSFEESWNLLCKKVFGEECCPPYLEGIGLEIVRICGGLPLSMVVIAGLLSMDKTVGYWETIATSVNSLLATDDGQCTKILSLSYNHLPAHLKPCFLYFAIFPEDYVIRRNKIITLWVAEGFVRPDNSKCLEDVAEEYLDDLVNRSLIMALDIGSSGKVKTYRIHDLLRDFCTAEVQKEEFLHVINEHVPTYLEGVRNKRRVGVGPNVPLKKFIKHISNSNGPVVLIRSLLCHDSDGDYFGERRLSCFRLLRILNMARIRLSEFPIEVVKLVHLRYIYLLLHCRGKMIFPASISLIRGLQTLIIDTFVFEFEFDVSLIDLPIAIWKMPHLRYIHIGMCYLPDPPSTTFEGRHFGALAELHTLKMVQNFRFSDEIIRRLPNLKKLGVFYDMKWIKDWSPYHLNNIVHLHKLETLKFVSRRNLKIPLNLSFPLSLKKLTLIGSVLHWEDLTIIGSLPNLKVLKLRNQACVGSVWEPNEGEFCQLQFLELFLLDLEHWRANNSHFPKLKCLSILWCKKLEEIPIEIGNIETLEMIELDDRSSSAVTSAEQILEEQRSYGNDILQVHIKKRSE